jgi:hypothetical protein
MAVAMICFVWVVADDRRMVVLFAAASIGICVYNTAHVLSKACTTSDGVLEVRNVFSAVYIHRVQVAEVAIDRILGVDHRVRLILKDRSSVPLLATEGWYVGGLRHRLASYEADLNAWIS